MLIQLRFFSSVFLALSSFICPWDESITMKYKHSSFFRCRYGMLLTSRVFELLWIDRRVLHRPRSVVHEYMILIRSYRLGTVLVTGDFFDYPKPSQSLKIPVDFQEFSPPLGVLSVISSPFNF